MRAWYDVSYGDLEGKSRRADEGGVRESEKQIGALIEREIGRKIVSKNIVLAGFSQGGAIALHTGLRYPQKLGGIMALSTYLPSADSLHKEGTPENKSAPIFMAHGIFDPVIPLVMGAGSMTLMMGLGYAVEWKQYPMQHSVCAEEVGDIGAWLRRVLNP
jgi:phospholipase/carboxylesterase